MKTLSDCPCGSRISYAQCCARFHTGQTTAPTAETLMRSRYSAYCLNNAAYLLATWAGPQRPGAIDFKEESIEWLKLEIVATKKGGITDYKGTVTFNAHFRQNGDEWVMKETSRFSKINNRWYYLDGISRIYPLSALPTAQNRNAACACGSGKKFKHCCGAT